MTYAVGGIIQAADYNGFVGNTAVNVAYVSDAAAQNKVAALIGVGYGTRGYGQTSTQLGDVVVGNLITIDAWNNLRNAMTTLNTHTGSALTLQPTVAVGDLIVQQGTIPTNISTLDTNRNLASLTQMTLSSALTSTRTTPWNGTLTHVFTVNFGSEDAARYYFNSGGQIRFSGSRVGGSATSINTAWTNLLNLVGTVKLGASTTTYTGSGGSITNNVGYFGLTGTYQENFIHYGTGPYYSGIYYSIQVRRENYVGANGGNGSLIRATVTFNDAGGYYYYYAGHVTGTLTSQIDQYKAGSVLTIANPTYTTVTSI
jgi:hypothetical protein